MFRKNATYFVFYFFFGPLLFLNITREFEYVGGEGERGKGSWSECFFSI